MTEEDIRQIIRQELGSLIKSDRFTFFKLLQILDGINIQIGLSNGTKIGTASTQKLGFWNATPVIQYATTGTLTGTGTDAGSPVTNSSTTTGSVGTKAYTIGDIVRALKNAGIMASS